MQTSLSEVVRYMKFNTVHRSHHFSMQPTCHDFNATLFIPEGNKYDSIYSEGFKFPWRRFSFFL